MLLEARSLAGILAEGSYLGKFVRAGRIVVISPNSRFTSEHAQLAQKEKIYEDFMRLRNEDRLQADAGGLGLRIRGDVFVATFYQGSSSLQAPTTLNARTMTEQVFLEDILPKGSEVIQHTTTVYPR